MRSRQHGRAVPHPARLHALGPSPGEPFTEASFTRRTIEQTFDPGEVALVLVDLWNLGWGLTPLLPEVGWEAEWERGRSNVERMRRITLDKIVPALGAARRAGLTIAHLNLPEIADRYYRRWRHRVPEAQGRPRWRRHRPRRRARANPPGRRRTSRRRGAPSTGDSSTTTAGWRCPAKRRNGWISHRPSSPATRTPS